MNEISMNFFMMSNSINKKLQKSLLIKQIETALNEITSLDFDQFFNDLADIANSQAGTLIKIKRLHI